jgi:pimeloyl-ACP methyl ester carboxylesterase
MKASLVAACVLSSALVANAEEAGPRHLIYLHGRIVQDQQDARPRHPEFGYYELEQILATFRERGFVVTGGIRPKDASLMVSADRVVEQIQRLVAAGVPASRITVVGGSMGAAIALRASLRLQNPAVRYCVLGACMSQSVPLLLTEYGAKPAGRILAIREKSDETSAPCPAWSGDAGPGATLVVREVVIDTGLRHGFLYRPLPEWVEPVVEWAQPPTRGTPAHQTAPPD